MSRRVLMALASLFLLAGCAIHPLPEDVTGIDTPDIVKQIRCESREAVQTVVIHWMNKLGEAGDPIAQRLAAEYAQNPEATSQFGPQLFKGPDYVWVRAVINSFYETGIAYNFDLNMTEDNDLTTQVNLLRVLPEHVFKLGFDAGALRKRSNQRTFTVTDTFKYLLTTLNDPARGRYCDGPIVRANYIYPIVGRIGIEKLVKDFIDLTLFGNLAGSDKSSGAPTMADKFVFTTTVYASATPRVEFTPVTTALRVANAQLSATARRTDMHQVAVALAVAKQGVTELGGLRSYLFTAPRSSGGARPSTVSRAAAGSGTLYVGDRVTGGGTASEVLAVIAIDQMKRREFQLYPVQ